MKRDKRGRFVVVAERRMRRLLRETRLLANLSNRSAYDYSERDVTVIISALEHSFAMVRATFHAAMRKDTPFKL